ncbi:aegerolysin type hemolysin [Hypoxylon cercidicola]|nr:aegerolysin type hemolysin [Hypoxylon cercidicola]
MAYAQWVVIQIINNFRSGKINVKNARIFWGKFHDHTNKDNEIGSDIVSKIEIPANSTTKIYSCGRSDSATGTEGQFDLYDGDHKICTIYWDCPWGSKDNNFEIRDHDVVKTEYMVSKGDWNKYSGALGDVDVEIARKG